MTQTVEYTTTVGLGENQLDLHVKGMDDRTVLETLADVLPKGINVWAGENAGPVWVNPTEILALSHPDGFGLELIGIAHTAAEIIRLAADQRKAELLGVGVCARYIKLFEWQADERSQSKRINQLHGVRWGSGVKVVCAERVAPGTFRYNPDGAWARKCSQMTGLFIGERVVRADDPETQPDYTVDVDEIAYEHFLWERHPFLGPLLLQAIPNINVTRGTVMFNRSDWRRATKGDEDGDTGNAFWVQPEYVQHLKTQLSHVLPLNDCHLLVRGIESHEKVAEMWGENIYEDGKTTQSRLDMSFTKPSDAWIASHAKMADCANRLTPFAYRISDIEAAMAALGIFGAADAAILGAVIEEDFYLGLTGGPEALDEAMETWFRKKLTRSAIAKMLAGIRTIADPALLTTEVKAALIAGSKYNQGRFDPYDPVGAIVKLTWLIGKGLTTRTHSNNPDPIGRLNTVAFLAGETDIPNAVRDNLIGKMAFYAGRHLAQFVKPRRAEAPLEDADWWNGADDDIADLGDD